MVDEMKREYETTIKKVIEVYRRKNLVNLANLAEKSLESLRDPKSLIYDLINACKKDFKNQKRYLSVLKIFEQVYTRIYIKSSDSKQQEAFMRGVEKWVLKIDEMQIEEFTYKQFEFGQKETKLNTKVLFFVTVFFFIYEYNVLLLRKIKGMNGFLHLDKFEKLRNAIGHPNIIVGSDSKITFNITKSIGGEWKIIDKIHYSIEEFQDEIIKLTEISETARIFNTILLVNQDLLKMHGFKAPVP